MGMGCCEPRGTAFDAMPARMTTTTTTATIRGPGWCSSAAWSSWCCRNSKLNGLNYFSSNRASVQFVAHSLSQFHYYKYYYYYYYCHSKFTVCRDSDSKRVRWRKRGRRGKQLPSFGDCDCCAFICNWNCVTLFFDFAIRVCLRFCIGIGHCHSQETHDSELAHARAAVYCTHTCKHLQAMRTHVQMTYKDKTL